MEKRKCIDLLKDDEEIKEIDRANEEFEYEFVNILYYAKDKYGLVITKLADFFNVKRQTIYNYFKLPSNDLPAHVKEKIQMVYGVITFNEVIELEKKVEFHTYNWLPTLDEFVRSDVALNQVPEDYVEVYDFEEFSPGMYQTALKPEFRFENFWKTAIHDKPSHEQLIYSKKQDETLGEGLASRINSMKKKYGEEYLKLMLKIIDKNVSTDDEEFLMYLMNFDKKQKS